MCPRRHLPELARPDLFVPLPVGYSSALLNVPPSMDDAPLAAERMLLPRAATPPPAITAPAAMPAGPPAPPAIRPIARLERMIELGRDMPK